MVRWDLVCDEFIIAYFQDCYILRPLARPNKKGLHYGKSFVEFLLPSEFWELGWGKKNYEIYDCPITNQTLIHHNQFQPLDFQLLVAQENLELELDWYC